MPSRPDPGVRIRAKRAGHGLFAAAGFAAEETVLVAAGAVFAAPTRGSLQIGPDRHLAVPADADREAHPWRFLNHACRPNARFEGRRLVALVRIESGAELTFDYETTEWELASPFTCACASPGCTARTIRGFRHLSPEEREERLPQLRADLRRLVLERDATG